MRSVAKIPPQWSAQCELPEEQGERYKWVMDRAVEMQQQGAQTVRRAYDKKHNLLLVEGWDKVLEADEFPPPHFHLQVVSGG